MMPGMQTLIDGTTLAAYLADPDWVVVDCRFDLKDVDAGARAYAAGHIPGARYAHLDHDLSGPLTPTSGRHPLPDPARLVQTLGGWGIGNDSQVVVYDAAGGSYAARLWWLLGWLGHARVAVLDGGLPQWQREGRPLSTALPRVTPRVFDGTPDNNLWLDTAAVQQMTDSAAGTLIDVRAPARFRGEVEPIDPVAGHIPGALNLPLTDNLDADGRFLPAVQLADLYRRGLGASDPQQCVFMCGSGVTACHSILALAHAGRPGARLYAGSWSEWIRDPARPLASGA